MNPREFYDDPEQLADATERSKMPQDFLDVRDGFVNQLSPGDRVLDVGCGPGHDIEYFEENGLDATGIDASSDVVQYVNDRGLDAEVSDMRDLDFDDSTFDGLWCNASIHFFPEDEMQKAIEEFYRVLSEEGVMHVSYKLGAESYTQELENKRIEHYLVTEDQAIEMVESAGFEVDYELTEKNDPGREEFDYFLNLFAQKPNE